MTEGGQDEERRVVGRGAWINERLIIRPCDVVVVIVVGRWVVVGC